MAAGTIEEIHRNQNGLVKGRIKKTSGGGPKKITFFHPKDTFTWAEGQDVQYKILYLKTNNEYDENLDPDKDEDPDDSNKFFVNKKVAVDLD